MGNNDKKANKNEATVTFYMFEEDLLVMKANIIFATRFTKNIIFAYCLFINAFLEEDYA